MDRPTKLKKCKCGSELIFLDTDKTTKATFIECKKCGRAVGGLSKKDAVNMWEKAMS